MRVLVLEDDADIRHAVVGELRKAGFAVDEADDLGAADEAVSVSDYDCLVLDRAVPSGDAIDFLGQLRSAGTTVPALFLTAKDTVNDRVAGFAAGGDDYLVKPFALAELVARVRALARRSATATPAVMRIADLELDTARAEVRRGAVLLPLTSKEFAVLELLAVRSPSIVSRTELIEHCWDEATDPLSNTVDVHVAKLRRKLGAPALITTVRNRGYVLEAPTS